MIIQKPGAFEFNENFLLFIVDHIYSGWFGNFLSNTEKERKAIIEKSFSIWLLVDNYRSMFLNRSYDDSLKQIIFRTEQRDIFFWRRRFMPWDEATVPNTWEPLGEFAEEPRGRIDSFSTDSAKKCTDCSVAFSLFTRRHPCQMCGLVFCYGCCGWRWESGYRICSSCDAAKAADIGGAVP